MLCSYNKVSWRKENVLSKLLGISPKLFSNIFPGGKNVLESGPVQFNPMLFKGQLYMKY